VPKKDKKLLQRFNHGAAALTVNSDCMEVISFGGKKMLGEPPLAEQVVLRFGR